MSGLSHESTLHGDLKHECVLNNYSIYDAFFINDGKFWQNSRNVKYVFADLLGVV
ncbi:hypothetical protein Mal48_06280 [Thalassoglobus polymorphus]|uniref:Uncharacterized protein n=1 Tax=Thalassoglobus polymorphus TaxID=2527994 RepID=A0A517QIF7_9PLAN|nr:hypothetical protein Mal48_06280 [Thalassoglobus polymorphus]